MIVAHGLMALVVGVVLLIFCLHGLCDPFWSRGTRIASAVGAASGLTSMVVGFFAIAST